MTNKYLSVLIIINLIIIIYYILLNVYINIELSRNLHEYVYVYVYNKFHIKEGGILFLLLNCNIKYVNRIETKRLFSSSNISNSTSNRDSRGLKGKDIST